MVNGISKCNHIKLLITLTSDNIKRLSLYLEFEDFFSKRKKLPSYIAKYIKINDETLKILRNIDKHWIFWETLNILRNIEYFEKHWIFWETLKKLRKIENFENIEKHWKYWEILSNIEKYWATLRHWKHWVVFQYIESQTLNSIQCQCGKLKHWKVLNVDVNVNFFNVSMWNSMFNVDLQTLNI